jgi:hypothetical protein
VHPIRSLGRRKAVGLNETLSTAHPDVTCYRSAMTDEADSDAPRPERLLQRINLPGAPGEE